MSSVEVAQRFFEEFPAYSEYKDSSIDWLGKIPKHWEIKKLKYVAPISDKKLDKKPDDVTYLGLENIESKTSRLLLDNPIEEVESAVNYFQKGNILFGKLRPYLAKVAYPDFSGVCTTELLVLNPNHDLSGKYLSYQMLADGFIDLVNSMTYGTKMPRANAEQIQNIEISFPSFSEQKQIAIFLDRATNEIDQIIEQQKQLITLLEEERTTVISHAVTKGLDPSVPMKDSGIEWLGEIPKHWDVKRLKWLVLQIGSGKTPKGGSEIYSDSGVIFIRSQNVHFDSLRLDDVVYIDESIDIEMASTRVLPQDVLLNITGASLGRCNIVPKSFPAANVNQHVCIIRPNPEKIDPEFLQNSISSNIVQGQIFAGENGTSRESLTFPQISNFVLVAPKGLEEQQKIISFIEKETDRIDEAIENVRSQIEKLEEYRTVLISDAVTGKIDVRGFN